MKKFNYENKQYLSKLDALEVPYYSKYVEYIASHLKNKKSKFLDVGCGNGVVLQLLKDKGYTNGYGIDVSKLFIKEARRRGLSNLKSYNGTKLPYDDNFFDLIGSFNVLEHTDNPEGYIREQVSKLKNNGILIIACPNFLSVLFPSYHHRLKGPKNKFNNLTRILNKLMVNKTAQFERMDPIIRKVFQYDDDAIVVTNIIDASRVLNTYGCTVIYSSGFINYNTTLFKMINSIPLLKYLLPSCFIVAQKS